MLFRALLLVLGVCSSHAFSAKRGLSEAECCSADVYCADLASAPFSWAYSWGLAPPASCPGAAHFEPMFWGAKSVANDSLLFTGSATHVLGCVFLQAAPRQAPPPTHTHPNLTDPIFSRFNEPNGKDQSNLTPQQAAALWPTVAKAAQAAGLKLVAPVPSGTDTAWLDAFFAACGGCEAEVDVVALHPYECSVAGLNKSLGAWAKFGKPLWVTEFNCGDGAANSTAAEHLKFMKAALPLLDGDARVQRYAWMSGRDKKVPGAALFEGPGGQLTELGKFYVS